MLKNKKNQIILIIALLLILLSTYLYINKLKNNEIINIENTENIGTGELDIPTF